VVTICTIEFHIQNFYVLPMKCVYVFVRISEQTQIFPYTELTDRPACDLGHSMPFVGVEVALGQIFFPLVLLFSPVSIIPPVFPCSSSARFSYRKDKQSRPGNHPEKKKQCFFRNRRTSDFHLFFRPSEWYVNSIVMYHCAGLLLAKHACHNFAVYSQHSHFK
jgi:hypothetical protein